MHIPAQSVEGDQRIAADHEAAGLACVEELVKLVRGLIVDNGAKKLPFEGANSVDYSKVYLQHFQIETAPSLRASTTYPSSPIIIAPFGKKPSIQPSRYNLYGKSVDLGGVDKIDVARETGVKSTIPTAINTISILP